MMMMMLMMVKNGLSIDFDKSQFYLSIALTRKGITMLFIGCCSCCCHPGYGSGWHTVIVVIVGEGLQCVVGTPCGCNYGCGSCFQCCCNDDGDCFSDE
jgi:hypothetical protein